jgi:carbon storage regulator
VLVLTRKTGEGIMVGDDVPVKVLRISGSRVTIGIEAPQSVRVQRASVDGEVTTRRGQGMAHCDDALR